MKTILYTKNFNKKIDEDVNIILSPHFYWVKKIEVPVKNILLAKKISKNLFDLDENEYIFEAFKINDTYFAFAIQKDLDLKIPKKFIKGIYLAQIELFNYDCINIDDFVIKKIEDIFFCFPKKENEKCIEFKRIEQNLKLQKKINIYNNLNLKSIMPFILFIIILNVFLLFQTINYKNGIKILNQKKEEIIQKYHLPPTTFQLNSIYQNLIDKYITQKRIKKDLEYISNTPIKKFISLSYENNKFILEINTTKNLNNYFSKHFKIKSFSINPYKVVLTHE